MTDALFNLIVNRLSSPASKNAVGEWQENQHGISEYETHQYYRAMDYLHDKKEEVEENLFETMKSHSKDLKSDVSIALFDTTTFVY